MPDEQKYISLRLISDLQVTIMEFVGVWIKKENTPVPRKEIIKAMEEAGKTESAVKPALADLLRKGYLRKAIMGVGVPLNETYYVKLRGV